MYNEYKLATDNRPIVASSIIPVVEMHCCIICFVRYSNHANDGVAGNLHCVVLKINEATFLPSIIDICQNLTELLPNYKGAVSIPTHCR